MTEDLKWKTRQDQTNKVQLTNQQTVTMSRKYVHLLRGTN